VHAWYKAGADLWAACSDASGLVKYALGGDSHPENSTTTLCATEFQYRFVHRKQLVTNKIQRYLCGKHNRKFNFVTSEHLYKL
jgi:hypothetical protein